MTAKATQTRRAAKAPKTHNSPPVTGSSAEAEFRRWTPEEVAANKWLPYSARMLREKCYRHELYHHRDGNKITFTTHDVRLNSEAGAVQPLSA